MPRVIRLSWPVLLLAIGFVVLLARNPRLLFSRAFFPVVLVIAVVLLVSYVRRPRRPGAPK
jgi:hypothetical protein